MALTDRDILTNTAEIGDRESGPRANSSGRLERRNGSGPVPGMVIATR